MIFERKDKAFREYERRMALPPPPPPADRDAPALWTRARDMFAALMTHVASLARLAVRPRLRRADRHEILARLIPVEKLARFLLTVEAVTFLLMTPEGARLRRSVTPAQPEPVRAKAPSRLMPAPGWHTIAATHPRIDPRIAENAERARLAAEAAARDSHVTQGGEDDESEDDGFKGLGLEAADPASWACSFHAKVDFNLYTDDCTESAPATLPTNRPRIEDMFDDADFPRPRDRKPRAASPEPEASILGPGAALARRIEALSRILKDPAAAIRRLARRLAALPQDNLWPGEPAWLADRWWADARHDLRNAAEMFCRALTSLWHARAAPPPEPG